MVSAMRNLNSVVFDHRGITYPMEVEQRVAYMQRIMRGESIEKYKALLMEYKQSENDISEDKRTLGYFKALCTEELWT